MDARTAIVIPARYGSSRFPGKALAPLCGRPLIAWVLERAGQVAGVSEVLVATDDARIAEAVDGLGGRAVMTRPDHGNGTERVAEVAAGLSVDWVVNLQGDEPLIDPGAIRRTLDLLLPDAGDAMATLATPIRPGEEDDPNVVKVVCDRGGRALYFSRAAIPHARQPGAAPMLHHVGVYAFGREFLLRLARLPATPLETAESLEQLRVLEHGLPIRVAVEDVRCRAVDTPEQLAELERELEEGP